MGRTSARRSPGRRRPLARSPGWGWGVTPTVGTVTINGTAITIDSATGLLGGAGDTVQAKLAAAGVTMTSVTDGAGNVTGVTLTSATPLQLGAPGDTSNLLAALRLNNAAPTAGGTTVTSNGALAGNPLSTGLGSLKLATALTSTAGTLNVNGTSLTYTSADTLGSIIGKINQSNAGVTASYDTFSDRMVLVSNTTGMGGISVSDTSGNLGAALRMTSGAGATVTPGAPAVFTVSGINGGNPIASATNTVTGIVPGVTLNLTGVSPNMTAAGATVVTVAQDTTAITTALQSFVTTYNAMQDTIAKYTAVQTDNTGAVQSAGVLTGDPGLSSLASDLDQTVNDTTVSLNGKQYSLASLGISTSSANSLVEGSVPSLDLQFTTATLTSALASTAGLSQAFTGNGTVSSQSGTLFDNVNKLLNTWTAPLGNLGTTTDSLTAEYAQEQEQLQNWQTYATAEQQRLSTMFTNMEASLSTIQAQGQALNSYFGTTSTSSTSSTSH